MAEYKGSIELIGGLKPKDDRDFPLVSAHDVQVDVTGKRLDEKLAEIGSGGGAGDIQTVEEMLQGFDSDPGSVKKYVDEHASGVHIGADEPTDGSAVWIDTDEQEDVPETLPETPSAGTTIDVVAEVGQTIVVKEVDAGGKPTKWEAAGYQPRTHWEDKDTTIVLEDWDYTSEGPGHFATISMALPINVGEVYNVYFDNILYICRAVIGCFTGVPCIALGNEALIGGINTGEPFAIGVIEAMGMSATTTAEAGWHTMTVTKSTIHPLDSRYYNNDFCINLSRDENNSWTIDKTADEIMSAYNSGMHIWTKYRKVGGSSTQPTWFDYKFTNFSVGTTFTQEGRSVVFDFSSLKKFVDELMTCEIAIAVAASGTSLISVGVEGIE